MGERAGRGPRGQTVLHACRGCRWGSLAGRWLTVRGWLQVSSMCKNNWWPEGLPRNASVRAWLERQLGDRHYLRTHVDNYQVGG